MNRKIISQLFLENISSCFTVGGDLSGRATLTNGDDLFFFGNQFKI